jgi:hypothetical protein
MRRRVLLLLLVLVLAFSTAIESAAPPFTVLVLPDTQYYSSYFEETFAEQTHWACECAAPLSLAFVSHVGDIVDRGNEYERDWLNAGRAMRSLRDCALPHGLLPGNHDVDKHADASGRRDRHRFFVRTFPLARFEGRAWFGGAHNGADMRNTYQLFEAPGGGAVAERFVAVHLEYLRQANDSAAVLAWASAVLEAHADRTALLATHYVGTDCAESKYPEGARQWYVGVDPPVRALMERHCNVLLAFGGHVFSCGGENAMPVVNRCNRTAYALVTDYQARAHGGDGWLRYYTFAPRHREVCAYTYSPVLQRFERDADSHFSIDRRTGALRPGCVSAPVVGECRSHYASPGFVLASVWIASVNLLLLLAVAWLLLVLLLLLPAPPSGAGARHRIRFKKMSSRN